MSETQLEIQGSIEQNLVQAENLINDNELNLALSILKNLEEKTLLNVNESAHHSRLMLSILEKYRKINELEKTSPLCKELALLYLGFEKYHEANYIFENLPKDSDDLLILYSQLRCLIKLELDISCLEKSFNKFLTETGLSPKQLEFAYIEIGTFYLKSTKNEELGIQFYEKAYELNPNCPELSLFFLAVHNNNKSSDPNLEKYIHLALKNTKLGPLPYNIAICTAINLDRQDLARELIQKLVENYPEDQWSYFYQATSANNFGCTDESLALLKQALAKNPQNCSILDNLVMNSHYSPTLTHEDILNLANTYHQNIIKPLIETKGKNFEFSKHLQKYEEEKIIRIGFVSGDFKLHPVFFWVNSLLKYFPKEGFEIHCYVNNEKNPFSESFHPLCHSLTYISRLRDEDLAEKIFNDKIHVLIDLSGHTAFNRLKTFARKPAPIQMTWLGQAGTTGLKEIDYIVADNFIIRKEDERFYTEKICYFPFASPYPANDYQNLYVNRSLARDNGKIILGSFNNGPKLNSRVLETWAEILKLVPETQILISNFLLTIPEYPLRLLDSFKKLGVDESRIEFELPESKISHLLRFNKIDIALDPFPFNGGTTTHETLMMSVPLVAIEGDRWASRMSAAVLKQSGLAELIVKNREDYINKIVNLAKSPQEIVSYKQIIREKYLNSPSTDMQSFSNDFAANIKNYWNQYCLKSKKNPENNLDVNKYIV